MAATGAWCVAANALPVTVLHADVRHVTLESTTLGPRLPQPVTMVVYEVRRLLNGVFRKQ